MIHSRFHQKPSHHNHSSRPFFSKASTARETAPFFSTHRSDVVQRMAETAQRPEEEELQVRNKPAEDKLQREMTLDEEEEAVQTKSLTATPIQRVCAECEEEKKKKSTQQPKLTVGQPSDPYEREADECERSLRRIDIKSD